MTTPKVRAAWPIGFTPADLQRAQAGPRGPQDAVTIATGNVIGIVDDDPGEGTWHYRVGYPSQASPPVFGPWAAIAVAPPAVPAPVAGDLGGGAVRIVWPTDFTPADLQRAQRGATGPEDPVTISTGNTLGVYDDHPGDGIWFYRIGFPSHASPPVYGPWVAVRVGTGRSYDMTGAYTFIQGDARLSIFRRTVTIFGSGSVFQLLFGAQQNFISIESQGNLPIGLWWPDGAEIVHQHGRVTIPALEDVPTVSADTGRFAWTGTAPNTARIDPPAE